MPRLPTTTNTAMLILTTLAIILTLLLTAACMGRESKPTPSSEGTDQELVEKIDELNQHIANLQEQLEALGTVERQEQPSTHRVGAQGTREPTATGAKSPIPKGTGICGRSPEIQTVLLEQLGLKSCKAATEEELYRITKLYDLHGFSSEQPVNEIKDGDLAGLVNLKEITLRSGTIRKGAFRGTRIESLRLECGTDIHPDAFEGSKGIKILEYHCAKEWPSLHDSKIEESLLELNISLDDNVAPNAQEIPLQRFTSLIQLGISGADSPGILEIPANWFDGLQNLRTVSDRRLP